MIAPVGHRAVGPTAEQTAGASAARSTGGLRLNIRPGPGFLAAASLASWSFPFWIHLSCSDCLLRERKVQQVCCCGSLLQTDVGDSAVDVKLCLDRGAVPTEVGVGLLQGGERGCSGMPTKSGTSLQTRSRAGGPFAVS